MSFPLINPSHQWFDTGGAPLVGGTIEFQNPSTSVKINTYPTADDADAQTNANANPITLDARGGFTGIYLEGGVPYKLIILDSLGAAVDTQDDVLCPASTAAELAITDAGGYYPVHNVEAALQAAYNDSLQNVSEDITPTLGGDLDGDSNAIIAISGAFIEEAAAATADVTASGQFWVRSDAPNTPMFTDDTGIDSIIDPGLRDLSTQNASYELVLADKGKVIHKASGGAGETITIPANASVAFAIGTMIAISNSGGGTLSVSITTDTLTWAADGSSGTRTLADGGMCVILKISATEWKVSGDGIT